MKTGLAPKQESRVSFTAQLPFQQQLKFSFGQQEHIIVSWRGGKLEWSETCKSTKLGNFEVFVLFLWKMQCFNALHEDYWVMTKLMAVGWHWVTLVYRGQIERYSHSSPVMQKGKGKSQSCGKCLSLWKS